MWKTPKDQAIDNLRALYRFDVKHYAFDKQMKIHQRILEEEQRVINARRSYVRHILTKTFIGMLALGFLIFIVFTSKC
jgi:hypothetical protein